MKSVPSRRGRGGGAAFSKKEQKMRQTKIITFHVMPRNGSQTHTHSVHICLYGYKDALGLSSVPPFECKLTNRSLSLSNSHTHTNTLKPLFCFHFTPLAFNQNRTEDQQEEGGGKEREREIIPAFAHLCNKGENTWSPKR